MIDHFPPSPLGVNRRRPGFGSWERLAGNPTAPIVPILLAVLPLVGCGGGTGADGRLAVTGSVTLNGAPLSDATIEFIPDSPGTGTSAGAPILGGQYAIPADKGLAPGDYKVSITKAGEGAPAPPDTEAPGDPEEFAPPPQSLPAKYNTKSILPATVEAGGKNHFVFELEL